MLNPPTIKRAVRSEWAWIPLLQRPLMQAMLIVAALVLGALLLGSWAAAAASSLAIVLLASVFALGLNPLVVWLESKGIPRGIGAVVVVLSLLSVIVGVIMIVTPMLYTQGTRFFQAAPEMLQRLKSGLPDWVQQIPGLSSLLSNKPNVSSVVGAGGTEVLSSVTSAASSVVNVIASLFLMVTMVIFMLSNPQPILRGAFGLIPLRAREPLERLLTRLGRQLSLWLMAALTVSAILGTLVAIGLALADFQDALLFGVIYAVCNMVPVVGPLVGMLPPVLFAASSANWTALIWAIVIPIALQQLDGYFLSPFMFRRTTQLHPMSILVSVSVSGAVLGFVGTFLAVPIAIIVKALVEEIYLPNMDAPEVQDDSIEAVLNPPAPAPELESEAEPSTPSADEALLQAPAAG